MFPLYLQYLLIDFRQNFVTGASWDTDDLVTFLGQKVKVQGHTIAAEAHSTRRYRRVQLFLVIPFGSPVSRIIRNVMLWRDFMKFSEGLGFGTRNNRLDSGCELDKSERYRVGLNLYVFGSHKFLEHAYPLSPKISFYLLIL